MRDKVPKASWFALTLCLAVAAALVCSSPGRGQESSAQGWQRFEVSADTYIDFYQPYRPHHFETTWLMLRADNKLVPLLRFDVSLIPSGSNVTMARLHLFVPSGQDSTTFRAPCKFAAFCIRRDWNPEQANWYYASDGVRWEAAGANGASDRCESHHPNEVAEVSAQGEWVDLLVTSIVQQWVAGENHGLVLRGYSEQFGRTAFYSSRFTDTSRHPWLEVQWSSPTPTPSPTVTGTATATPSPTHTSTNAPTATPSPTTTPHSVYLPITARND